MVKFTYQEVINKGPTSKQDEDRMIERGTPYKRDIDVLNDFGKDGWECFQMTRSNHAPVTTMYFKKKILD